MSNWTRWHLLADREKFRYMGENFRGEQARVDTHDVLLALLCLAALVFALWLLSAYVARREKARRTYSPRGLFQRLCQAHGLDRASRKKLWQLAQQERLEHPAQLFLEPERFTKPSPLISRDAETYRALMRQLFGPVDA